MTGRHRAAGRPAGKRLKLVAWVSAGLTMGAAAVGVLGPAGASPPPTPAFAWAAGPLSAQPEPSWAIEPPAGRPPAVARPVRLRIPAIGVDSPLVDLGMGAAGELVPPADPDTAGWYTGGPAPGAVGPALLAGHVDSYTGPAVFHRLADLKPGDPVEVTKADGGTVEFTVSSTQRVAKTAFPTDLVYAPLPVPMLRLVTCGGTFDHVTRGYRDNIIVEAQVV